MPQCAIKNCKSNLGPKSPYYSYYFPKPESSPERFAGWCRHSRPSCVRNRSSRVCALHFTLEDFDRSDMLKIRLTPDLFKNLTPKLRAGVVPSVNLDAPDEKEEASPPRKQPRKRKVRDEEDSRPSTSCEVKVEKVDETPPPRNGVGIQCELGAEVCRGFHVGGETVDK